MNIALIGLAIFLISAAGGLLLVKRHTQQPKQVKAVLFGLYFWGLAFLQLMIASFAYYLIKK
ncbi:MAG: hypothetical protein ACU84H_00095 [Gammaproteobacteria bacterium]